MLHLTRQRGSRITHSKHKQNNYSKSTVNHPPTGQADKRQYALVGTTKIHSRASQSNGKLLLWSWTAGRGTYYVSANEWREAVNDKADPRVMPWDPGNWLVPLGQEWIPNDIITSYHSPKSIIEALSALEFTIVHLAKSCFKHLHKCAEWFKWKRNCDII